MNDIDIIKKDIVVIDHIILINKELGTPVNYSKYLNQLTEIRRMNDIKNNRNIIINDILNEKE